MSRSFHPTYRTIKCSDLSEQECCECSYLFSTCYGKYSGKDNPAKKGLRIKLSPARYQALRKNNEMFVSLCQLQGIIIGTCFFLKKTLANGQKCVWITQLVVHSSYRKIGIATRLLQSAWGFSDYFAWGLATANSITVKTLESVTWRKVDPTVIFDNLEVISKITESLPYPTQNISVDPTKSLINTNFFIEREKHESTDEVYIQHLGELPEGHEWLAFTFQTQEMYFDEKRFNDFIEFSAEQLNDAYSRMDMSNQSWAKGTVAEVDFVEQALNIQKGSTLLDIGCGQGRHCIELAKRGYRVTGIDASEQHIAKAKENAGVLDIHFRVWDARKRPTGKSFDAVICLYDVVGSFRTLDENVAIIRTIASKLRKGGRAVLSVMNMRYIQLRARHRGNVASHPHLLLNLPASNHMQATGNMFDMDYQLLDEEKHLVYHKEQFEKDGLLSAEYVVADYRFTQAELQQILSANGLRVIESRFVRAGHFDVPLPEEDDNAKEILFVVEKA
ncbi:MAG: bifunctional N-acetyltransferase/class I SAM-dependent methyltransferase [Bacteroidales bacterium]|nr:bifunctional N-acetyltransferase/class I SAM-dependent methyltransferase [Bacteroidales bacterium]